jgi:hypothetical protein
MGGRDRKMASLRAIQAKPEAIPRLKNKRIGSVVQVIEHLPSMHKD